MPKWGYKELLPPDSIRTLLKESNFKNPCSNGCKIDYTKEKAYYCSVSDIIPYYDHPASSIYWDCRAKLKNNHFCLSCAKAAHGITHFKELPFDQAFEYIYSLGMIDGRYQCGVRHSSRKLAKELNKQAMERWKF